MRRRSVSILTQAVLIFWSIVCLFPLYWIAVTSLKDEAAIMQGPFYLPFIDFMPTLGAWRAILTYDNDTSFCALPTQSLSQVFRHCLPFSLAAWRFTD